LWRYHHDYEPVVRPTWLDFPADAGAWVDGDDFLLGPDLLVALVCDPGVVSRSVRPPLGADWIDLWTGIRVEGGTSVSLDAPLDGPPPLLARSGSAIPVDLARGGFRPEPYRRGLWLFPHQQAGEFSWSFYEDEGERFGPHTLWRGTCRSTREALSVVVDREGPATFGDSSITILLPPGEKRPVHIEGRSAQPVEFEGRRGLMLVLPLSGGG
jgi:alpha-glucosidase